MGIHHSGLRRLVSVADATIIGGTLAAVTPLQASASPPVVVQDERIEDEFVVDGLCEEGAFTVRISVKVRETMFFDKDGNFVKATIHVNGTDIVTGDGGELFDRYAWNGTFDPATGIFFERGNQWNVHAGAGGILVNDSGLIKFTFDENGEFVLLRNAGPLDTFPDGPGDPCGILFP